MSSMHNNVVELHSRFRCVSNMRLHRVQQRVLNGDLNCNGGVVPSMKGALGRNAIGWMKICFNLNCEVMPTTDRLHIITHDEKDMMPTDKIC